MKTILNLLLNDRVDWGGEGGGRKERNLQWGKSFQKKLP